MGEGSQLRKLTSAADRVGTSLCGWRVERLLGVGPVCESWFAVAAGKAGRAGEGDRAPRAVLRILREPFSADEGARAEWLGASWAPNRFSHPWVPRTLQDGADADGAPVVVRAWAEGQSLDELVQRGVLGVEPALRLAEQMLDALEMAHAHRVVHGALTPSNVIVTSFKERRSARLVDFGVAPPGRVRTDALRRAHVSRYTAPEREASEAADVWSVGACLYFAIAGEAPSGPAPTLRPLRARSPRDQALVAVVGRALAADAADRYPSAYAMLGDVRRILVGRPPRLGGSVTPVSSQRTALAERSSSQRPALVRRTQRLPSRPPASAASAPYRPPVASSARPLDRGAGGERRGNLLLFVAIALAAAVAAYVVARDRAADPPDPPPALASPAS